MEIIVCLLVLSVSLFANTKPKIYTCPECGYIYDNSKEKIPFKKLPFDWDCPICGTSKEDF